MAAQRTPTSITLPRSFYFHYKDGPKTPEPQQAQAESIEPPRLFKPAYRIRRRRGPLPSYDVHANAHDMPIPSIETTEAPLRASFSRSERPDFLEGFLQPEPVPAKYISPPKTPSAKIVPDWSGFAPFGDWSDVKSHGDSISRPSSSCSGISESSLYSALSSFGGSCTSPEDECDDPFMYSVKPRDISHVQAEPQSTPTQVLRKRKNPKVCFTRDMDTHLWLTYMRYLQDPTVTPFKMLPGVAPPQGVCRRVARNARKTWRGPRRSIPARSSSCAADSPDSLKPSKSGSTTPTITNSRKPYTPWPRNDAGTRQRLREIIKRKPSLSAHYTRIVRARTPSPLPSPQPTSRDTPMNDTHSSFSRDMNVSLVASTASSMRAGNPLSSLAEEAPTTSSNDSYFDLLPDRPFVPHQKSQSLHIRTNHNPSSSANNFRSLRSPFTGRPQRSERTGRSHNVNRGSVRASSPLHEPLPLPRAFKRRALYPAGAQDESSRELALQELFGAPAEMSHRRIRSRGFSLGDTGDGARNLSSLFTPPSLNESFQQTNHRLPLPTHQTSMNLRAAMGHNTVRLGSPFSGTSANVRFNNNTFPRNFTPCQPSFPEDSEIMDNDF